MTSGFFIGQQDLDKIISDLSKTLREELTKVRSEVVEAPMTAKETAKFLKCHVNTVYSNWTHLRHVVNGTPYWLASELLQHIKSK
jgi:DNA-binding CsgD family transcriptional regulator